VIVIAIGLYCLPDPTWLSAVCVAVLGGEEAVFRVLMHQEPREQQ